MLQSYLFAGFPRALNAAREWRKSQAIAGPAGGTAERRNEESLVPGTHEGYADVFDWRERGEETCRNGLRRIVREAARKHQETQPIAR